MSIKTLHRSFAGGELTPELLGRIDLAKFQTGLDTCRNFISLPYGPAVNRAGFKYVIETKDSTKGSVLIPFIYSTSQAYVLEFGDQYMRIHTEGGTVLEANQNIIGATQANPGVLEITAHGYVVNQWVYVASIVGMTELNGRYYKVNTVPDVNHITLKDLAGNVIDTTGFTAYTSGGTIARVYEIATPYLEADLPSLHYTQSADVLTIVHKTYQQRHLSRLGATNWTLTAFSFAPTQAAPTSPVATATVGSGSTTYKYKVAAIATDGQEESLPTTSASCTNNLTTAGNYNTITWTNASGAIRYNIYKDSNGVYGYIGQSSDGTTGLKDDNISPDMSKTVPETEDPFVGAGNYPAAVGYFKGRRWFAGTTNKPQNLWGTRSGTESSMVYSIPVADDNRIAVRLTARQANSIRHIVPLGDMLLFTSGAEWLITSQNSDAITPTSIDYKTQGYIGASDVQPVVTNRSVLYAQDRGGRVREMLYKWESQGYDTNDISIMAPHLFDEYSIVSMTYTRAPYSAAWCVRSDGVLLGCTYVPEHQVIGWHRHDTAGTFESVSAIPEGSEDALYAIVKRSVDGRDVRYVEVLHPRVFATIADCFFVDSGATYDGAAATTIKGLWHLEGENVVVLADGAVVKDKTVSNGQITLDQAASKVHVGLPYVGDLKTLPLRADALQAAGQGTVKNVNGVHLRVKDASSIFVGPSFDALRQVKQRTTEPYGSPPNLVTGVQTIAIDPLWDEDGAVCVRQADPLPISVLSMTMEVEFGG